jgi:hypothetical protein
MHEMRHLAASKNSPLNGLVMRALEETGGWSVDAMRAPGFRQMHALENAAEFRTAAPLPDTSQKVIDGAVVEVGLSRLTFVADILAAGLTYDLTDPLSVTQLEWNAMNKVGAAQRTMSPSARGENKLPNMLPYRLPIYLTTDTFELDIRTLKMSRRVGLPLDTALIKQCTRSVNEAIEDAAINGATTLDGQALAVAGYTAPGLLNAPNAEAQALTLAAWTTAPVGATVHAETQLMINKLVANKKFGPYRMYVGTTISAALDSDYDTVSASRGLTIRERLLKMENLQAIRTADLMPANKVAIVQMTSDVIDMVVGQRPTVIPWTSLDGFTFHNLVMAIMIPRVRSDYNGDSGICIGTAA